MSHKQIISYVDTNLDSSQKYFLVVDGKPFYMTSIQVRLDKLRYRWGFDAAARKAVIGRAAADGFNTVSIPIQWYEVEPQKDQFDWSVLDEYMRLCTTYGLKMEMLWFSHNSGGNTQWLGTDKKPVHLRTPDYILYSPGPKSKETKSDYRLKKPYTLDLKDKKLNKREAYVLHQVMEHISRWDKTNGHPHTVIGVQLGNEVEGFDPDVVIAYLNVLAKAVKKSSYSIWTRINCTYWNRLNRLDVNEKLRTSEEGTFIDFVGYDTYRHHFKSDTAYKESMRTYFPYKGKNYRMVMEIGAKIPIIAQLQLAAISGNLAFDYYDMLGPDGLGLYIRKGQDEFTPRGNYIKEVRTVNKLINSDITDIALLANGYGLFIHNWKTNSLAPTKGVDDVIFKPVSIASQGISIHRSDTEIILMNTKGGTFTYPESLDATAASRGYFNGDNKWVNQGSVPFTSTSITPPAGTTIRLLHPDDGVPQPRIILQAESGKSGDGAVVSSGNGLVGFAGNGYVKLSSQSGAYIRWSDVDGLTGGDRMIRIRYSYTGTQPAKDQLSVNGKEQMIYLQPADSKGTYKYFTITVSLNNSTNNTIQIESIGTDSGGNIDELQVF